MKARKLITIVGTLATVISSACEDRETATRESSPPVAPDNSGRNKIDPPSAKTPMDQSQSSADVTIVAEIRKAIISDSQMSMDAQNCKVIVQNGAVTLRGVVATQAEKDSIESKAKAVAGVSSVDNQLEVKPN